MRLKSKIDIVRESIIEDLKKNLEDIEDNLSKIELTINNLLSKKAVIKYEPYSKN
jgi:hypothetical protein